MSYWTDAEIALYPTKEWTRCRIRTEIIERAQKDLIVLDGAVYRFRVKG